MAELTFEIPEDLEFMKKVSSIDWSLLFNKLLRPELEEIARLKRIVSKSKLAEKDVEEFSDRINASLSQRYLKSD